MKIVLAKEALEYDKNQDEAIRQLQLADQIRGAFTSWFRVTVESVRRDKRMLKCLDLKAFVSQLCSAWKEVLEGKDIRITTDFPESDMIYRCFPYEFEIILNNLITNSVTVLEERKGAAKEIRVALQDQPNGIVLTYSDNGPGLASAYKSHPEMILEAFESDKTNDWGEMVGTGMGMWLIKRTIADYNGT